MKGIVLVVLGIAGTVPVMFALHMLAESHFNPRWLALFMDSAVNADTKRSRRMMAWAHMILAIIGFGIMGYAGAYAVLWWIPEAIGMVDGDGDYTSARALLAAIPGFWVGWHVPKLIAEHVTPSGAIR